MVGEFRRVLLERAFALLYGPLAFLHEPAGRALAGPAWSGRRELALDPSVPGVTLDVGCGDGRLVALATRYGQRAIGVDPSKWMVRRAKARGAIVVRASAAELPFGHECAALVIATYPGPWVFDEAARRELARVLAPGGRVRILLGGTTTRGRFARVRSAVARLVYGSRSLSTTSELPTFSGLRGSFVVREDAWGESLWWLGERSD